MQQTYSAKAAWLIRLANSRDTDSANNDPTTWFPVPPFIPVATTPHDAWLRDAPAFTVQLQALRDEAKGLLQTAGVHNELRRLVIIRSSAQQSEDSQEHSAAGLYKSVLADPADADGFRAAVEEVFASAASGDAQ